jgi:hypothetical protein
MRSDIWTWDIGSLGCPISEKHTQLHKSSEQKDISIWDFGSLFSFFPQVVTHAIYCHLLLNKHLIHVGLLRRPKFFSLCHLLALFAPQSTLPKLIMTHDIHNMKHRGLKRKRKTSHNFCISTTIFETWNNKFTKPDKPPCSRTINTTPTNRVDEMSRVGVGVRTIIRVSINRNILL